MLIYDKGIEEYKNWILCEANFDSRYQGKCESIMALGNGYLGLRSALEENYVGQTRNLFVAGSFNRFHPDEVTELPNAADISEIQIYLNSELFTIGNENTLQYVRYLNLKEAELYREVLWKSQLNELFKLEFRRFVSLENLHTIAFKLNIVPLSNNARVTIKTGIDGRMTNSGSQHFSEGDRQVYDKKYIQLIQTTTESKIDFAFNCYCCGYEGNISPSQSIIEAKEFGVDRRKIFGLYEFDAKKDIGIVFEKLINVFTSRDKEFNGNYNLEALKTYSLKHIKELSKQSYDSLFKKSKGKWHAYWENASIDIISSNENDILAVRFALYHMLIMTPIHDERFSIGAKGLTGEGYKGHVFWDTEMFILPYFQYNMPAAARQLLLYRYKNLGGARNKALKYGYKGAMYPWETAFTGEEETPEWAALNIMTGKPTRVWSGIKEHHITADIAYAVWQYYLSTDDYDFMKNYGYEIIFECAWFWCSRLYWNNELSRYEIRDIIGPDEYTEHIDNNAYTNYMAHYVISLGLKLFDQLNSNNKKLFIELDEKLKLWERYELYSQGVHKLYLPAVDEQGVIPQDDTFLNKEKIDISKYRNNNLKQSILLDYSRSQIIDMQVLKQADAVMLFYTLRKLFDKTTIEEGWKYYEPKTIHDSSLSKAVHSIVAANFGNIDDAYGCFKDACMLDMGENPISSNAGIHAAAMGGIWMNVVFGFGGVYNNEGSLELNPILPAEWSKLGFCINWKNVRIRIDISREYISISSKSETEIKLKVHGKEYSFNKKMKCVMPKK